MMSLYIQKGFHTLGMEIAYSCTVLREYLQCVHFFATLEEKLLNIYKIVHYMAMLYRQNV